MMYFLANHSYVFCNSDYNCRAQARKPLSLLVRIENISSHALSASLKKTLQPLVKVSEVLAAPVIIKLIFILCRSASGARVQKIYLLEP